MTATTADEMWHLNLDSDRIAWLEFDKPNSSANTLSHAAMDALDQRVAELEKLNPRAVVVLSAKDSGFIAGADIKEFTALTNPDAAYQLIRRGQKVLDRLEALRCPTIAAIHGFALGGGMELALACRYRIVASDGKTSLGLPEIQLGIHPGFGGTIRAVQLIGPVAAMDLILTGRNVRADKALQLGLVDKLVPQAELRNAAKQFALNPPSPHRPAFSARVLNWSLLRPFIANKMRQRVAKQAPSQHYPAPYAVIDLWQRYGARGVEAYDSEAHSIANLFSTPTSRNLVRVFLLQDRLKSLGGKGSAKAQHAHVVGAGVMGGDIATWCAVRGLNVSLQDRAMQYILPALDRAKTFLEKRYSKQQERDDVTKRLTPDVDATQVSTADVVIEAIFENVAAKKELYARLEPKLKPGAILATNTSSIVLESLSDGLQDPGRFVGLHFFNPVARMPLVEIIQSKDTRPEVVQAAIAFTRQLDKLPVPCRSAPGFVVNRILMPYLNEAMRAVDEGVSPTLVDKVATSFGMPMGPIELADVIGLDVGMHVGAILAAAYSRPQAQCIKTLVDQKKLGKKSGAGFYTWQDGKPVKPPITGTAPADLEDRLILAMVNESMAVLREQVVADADLLDAAVIFGTGFAPFRGGPLNYARSVGVATVISRLEQLASKYGVHFKPDDGWKSGLLQ
ncbi:MAG TPA: 3-hydroxyacyl-CoA dehydrogenase NAD-binding domain-containing protein [Steroidobacteraceae bacterium]|nr:3-hydroxyacyl-CoA dehydrogenase NAD-binding domain-containing protein [Steroidobacteraceae bacterium]